jgi:hypothetical protein
MSALNFTNSSKRDTIIKLGQGRKCGGNVPQKRITVLHRQRLRASSPLVVRRSA